MTQASDWQGAVGDIWAREWQLTDRSFSDLAPRLNRAILSAAPDGTFTALDIGCGAGATSLALAAARADARVVGVDLSESLIATAGDRGAGLGNLHFLVADAAEGARSVAPVDLFCSRHGVMFFDDPTAAFSALRVSAAPGASIVFSCFDIVANNPWATLLFEAAPAPAYAPGPFAFADPDRVAAILAKAGWRDAAPARVAFRYLVGQGDDPIADAENFITRIGPSARGLKDAMPEHRELLLIRLREALSAARDGDTVAFPASAWLWSAKA